MSNIQWTEDQNAAIETRGGGIVVSAAAGSGKTAVLVERVIRLLMDEKAPIPPERLLVVTFTRAAAAEMKQKIKAALRTKATESPSAAAVLGNIEAANISTMDSFCAKLVRENFEPLGISPDFRILDDPEEKSLEDRAMSETLEEFYTEKNPIFIKTVSLFLQDRDDRSLAKGIHDLYQYSIAYAQPDEWLDSIVQAYEEGKTPSESIWGSFLIKYVTNNLTSCLELLYAALNSASADMVLEAAYGPAIHADIDRFNELRLDILHHTLSWDEIANRLSALKTLTRLKSARGIQDKAAAEAVKQRRERIKQIIKGSVSIFSIRSSDFAADREILLPVIEMLTQVTKRYAENLASLKRSQNAYHFSDILHFAIDLNFKKIGGKQEITPLGKKLAASYDAVLIDEYQDTTKAQDALFAAISDGGKNMFVVGDVKQSIYGFRLATPEIFNQRCQSATDYKKKKFPARIILGKNFRSCAGILEFVNFVFKGLMTKTTGGVDYNESEYLYYGGSAGEDMNVVDCLFTSSDGDLFEEEAKNIAKYINQTVAEGKNITVKGETRPIRFSDFCILLRTVSGKAEKLAEYLKNYQIPVIFEKSVNRFAMPEAEVLFSLLSIIDNPQSDVELLSVLFFPLFGFSPDELAQIRYCSKDSLYHCVTACAAGEGAIAEKCRFFLSELRKFRNDALSMKTSAFLRHLIYETDFASLVYAMPGGRDRLSTLEAFIDCAKKYEDQGNIGFSGFIRYMSRIHEANQEVSLTVVHGDIENAVQIMSIHKSKGLEFPYVILADTAKRFNLQDAMAPLITDIDFTAAIKIQDRFQLKKYDTLPYAAIKTAKQIKAVSEEMRLLYVALTRASHRLILSAAVKDIEKAAGKIAALLPEGEEINPFIILQCKSHLDFLFMALLRHHDCAKLRDLAGVTQKSIPCTAGVALHLPQANEDIKPVNDEKKIFSRKPFSPELFEEIKNRIEYRYPYLETGSIPAKITASGFQKGGKSYQNANLNQPSFVKTKSIGGTARGNAYHKFLQHCDFEKTAKNFEQMVEDLVKAMLITKDEAEMLSKEKILTFLDSPIGLQIRSADKVYREFEFIFMMPVKKLYPEISSDDEVLVQGVADLVFLKDHKAIVLDYKTNARSDDEYLIQLYRPQLTIYKEAIENLLSVPVEDTILYSFSASRAIQVKTFP